MAKPRTKGKRGELEVAALLRSMGVPARRGQQFTGGGDSPDVSHALEPILHIEVKFVERVLIEDWYDQALLDGRYRTPLIIHRRTAKGGKPVQWIATTMLRDLMHLVNAPSPDDCLTGDSRDLSRVVAKHLGGRAHLTYHRSNALRFTQRFEEATTDAPPGIAPGLAHARTAIESPWYVSFFAEDLLEIAIQEAMERYGFEPMRGPDGLAPNYEGEVERHYRRFWEEKRTRLASEMPLFRGSMWE